MTTAFDLIISGGTAVLPGQTVQADIGIAGGKIVEIGSLDTRQAADVFVARGLHVLPGVIDSQVHFREPGLEHKEDLETGSRAAILGGVTAVFEMPNTSPSTISAESFADKIQRAAGRMFCDHAFFIGGTADNIEMLAEFERLPGCAGIKVFLGSSTGSLLVEAPDVLRAILSRISRRSSYHCEDEARLRERKPLAEPGNPATHPVWRDEIAALMSTERLVNTAHELGKPVHVLHVSTAEEMEFLRNRKANGLVSVEVTPHHLTLAAPEAYERLGTLAQMNPPVRDARHRDALWAALADGVVDVLGSDHAPHTLEEKARPYPQSPSGMPGVQTLVPLMLNHVNAGRLSLERFADLSSAAPARLFGAEKRGRIEIGFEAHFTVVDLEAEREITNSWIASKCGWTPYDGMLVKGWPIATIVSGRVVMLDGAVMADACGRPVTFAGQSSAVSATEGTSDGAPTPR